jgi:hypothetical protein
MCQTGHVDINGSVNVTGWRSFELEKDEECSVETAIERYPQEETNTNTDSIEVVMVSNTFNIIRCEKTTKNNKNPRRVFK